MQPRRRRMMSARLAGALAALVLASGAADAFDSRTVTSMSYSMRDNNALEECRKAFRAAGQSERRTAIWCGITYFGAAEVGRFGAGRAEVPICDGCQLTVFFHCARPLAGVRDLKGRTVGTSGFPAAHRVIERLGARAVPMHRPERSASETDCIAAVGLKIAAALAQHWQESGRTAALRTAIRAPKRPAPAPPRDMAPLSSFKDCEECPEMVVLPRGSYRMGHGPNEIAYLRRVGQAHGLRGLPPQSTVSIDYTFAIGKFELTIAEFAAFVADTGYDADGPCFLRFPTGGPQRGRFLGEVLQHQKNMAQIGAVWVRDAGFRQPGWQVPDDHPAACISRLDAQAYLDWLGRKTGRPYRLPSAAEWEYAARAGTDTAFFWGNDPARACEHANFGDRGSGYVAGEAAPCAEQTRAYATTPVGSFKPNAWGIHDIIGNVHEMVLDCPFDPGIVRDGSPFVVREEDEIFGGGVTGDCVMFGGRGWQFESIIMTLMPAIHVSASGSLDSRSNTVGLRVAVSLDGPAWDLE